MNVAIGALVVGLVLLSLVRRFRSMFGRQALRPGAIGVRSLMLAGICVVLLVSPQITLAGYGAAACGAVAGVAIAGFGLSRTRFERAPEGLFYVPDPYVGLAVTGLFVARLAWRMSQVYFVIRASSGTVPPSFDTAAGSPLTLALYFMLAAYYVLFGAGLLLRSRTAV